MANTKFLKTDNPYYNTVDLSGITRHEDETYTFMPCAVRTRIERHLNENGITDYKLYALRKHPEILPAGTEIPTIYSTTDSGTGHLIREDRNPWVLISHLDPDELSAVFEDIEFDITKEGRKEAEKNRNIKTAPLKDSELDNQLLKQKYKLQERLLQSDIISTIISDRYGHALKHTACSRKNKKKKK